MWIISELPTIRPECSGERTSSLHRCPSAHVVSISPIRAKLPAYWRARLLHVFLLRSRRSCCRFSFLLDPPGRQVLAILMHDQCICAALVIEHESDLQIVDLQEKVILTLWKYLDLLLPSGLRKEVVTFPSDSDNEVWH